MTNISDYTPSTGALTFNNEGHEGGIYHSRKLHVPSSTSGITLGRGYDMKEKSVAQVKADLLSAKVPAVDADKISKGAGLSGDDAKKFIKDNGLENFEIEMDGQKILFEIAYQEKERYAKHLCTKPDVTKKYGTCHWESLDKDLRDIVVDLTFRGDYNRSVREKMQKAIVTQDFDALVKSFSKQSNFGNVDNNRFNARLDAIKKLAEAKRVQNSLKPQ